MNKKQIDGEIEEISDEELQLLVLEAQREALEKEALEKTRPNPKRPFPRWIFWTMAFVLFVNTFAMIFQIYSIPAIEFIKTSARLSAQENIAQYKEAVVVVLTDDSKGTGFSISSEGRVLTNYHVVEDNDSVIVGFPEAGRFKADVIQTYPSIDLAVLQVHEEELPYLELSENPSYEYGEPITFIGNPLKFTGIANEGTLIATHQLSDWDVPVMMMEAPVYRGNSGSPVLDKDGQVIGVVFATLDHEEHGKVGLFVPIEEYYKTQK
ncbi:Trypsin-like peptidase domain-containing protein [Psychrobacillus sp. OK028]|uniref:S1 family peptidase n=1 Tax=Psychrobacillus sp. OK028 TaxID=1884359 RepID=UPI0008910B1F|nr:serine protease [Psychrobacillus sp. OK028]SDN56496.1 Trypsin-like peptidase domain-containing protein [Psychrobacillus sp. OK028]